MPGIIGGFASAAKRLIGSVGSAGRTLYSRTGSMMSRGRAPSLSNMTRNNIPSVNRGSVGPMRSMRNRMSGFSARGNPMNMRIGRATLPSMSRIVGAAAGLGTLHLAAGAINRGSMFLHSGLTSGRPLGTMSSMFESQSNGIFRQSPFANTRIMSGVTSAGQIGRMPKGPMSSKNAALGIRGNVGAASQGMR